MIYIRNHSYRHCFTCLSWPLPEVGKDGCVDHGVSEKLTFCLAKCQALGSNLIVGY